MIQATVKPSMVSGIIQVPASKSAMQRACAAALIKGGKTILHNPGISEDDRAALDIIQQLGAQVEEENGTIIIKAVGIKPVSDTLHCRESGLSLRMFTSIAAVSGKRLQITGKGSLVKRPVSFFDEVFPALGVKCESNGGRLPLTIQGPLQPVDIEVDGSLSSQFLTGLIFAYSATAVDAATITVKELNSRPYIDLTLEVMKAFGLRTPVNNQYQTFEFKPAQEKISSTPFHFTIEGDWSGSAFLLVAAAINGHLTIKGLNVFSVQADKSILQPLMQAGAIMSITEHEIEIRQNRLQPFHFIAKDAPDLFPPLVALAACCEGTSVIAGVSRLEHKESNRALTLQEEFGKLGLKITIQDDLMIIYGGQKIKGGVVHSHGDHRIAMACAVAALKAEGAVTITGADAVNKSYPQFWEHLKKLNAELSLINN